MKRVQQSSAIRSEYESRQYDLEDSIARVVSVMKIFEDRPPNGKTPSDWINHARSLKLDVIGVWDELIAEEQSGPMPEVMQKVGSGETAAGEDAQPTQETGEPHLKQKSRNSRAAVDKWVKWKAKQMVEATDTMADLAGKIQTEADRWGYESERGSMTIASITKMIPAGQTGGLAKNKGVKGKAKK